MNAVRFVLPTVPTSSTEATRPDSKTPRSIRRGPCGGPPSGMAGWVRNEQQGTEAPAPRTTSSNRLITKRSSPLRYCPVEPCFAASVRWQVVHASCMLIRRGDDQSVGWFCRDEACRRESPRMPTTGSLPDQRPGVSSVAVSGTAVRTLITTTVTSSRSLVLPAKSVTALYRAATMLRAVSSQCCETT